MLVNGNTPVYVPAPIGVGVAEYSAGNFEQTKVSWMKRTRRKAMFAKYCAWRPGSVRTPTVGACAIWFAGAGQSPSVNVFAVASNVGHVFDAAVKS
jgi:hypothetical protein